MQNPFDIKIGSTGMRNQAGAKDYFLEFLPQK